MLLGPLSQPTDQVAHFDLCQRLQRFVFEKVIPIDAFANNRIASSCRVIEKASLPQRRIQDGARYVSPFLDLRFRKYQHINRKPESRQTHLQAHHFRATVPHGGEDDQQVEIAFFGLIAPCTRTKKDDFARIRLIYKTPYGFVNHTGESHDTVYGMKREQVGVDARHSVYNRSNTHGGYAITRPGYVNDRDALRKRVNRLEGQVRGVGRMIDEDRYCIDIVNQLSAVQAAARELSLQLLERHVEHCVVDAVRSDNAEPKIRELIDSLGKAMGR